MQNIVKEFCSYKSDSDVLRIAKLTQILNKDESINLLLLLPNAININKHHLNSLSNVEAFMIDFIVEARELHIKDPEIK